MSSESPDHGEITALLNEWSKGDVQITERLLEQVYPHLRQIARNLFRGERADNLLQPTSVVNELFFRLVQLRDVRFDDRQHFYRMAARMMRHILIDHARSEMREKRDGRLRVPLTEGLRTSASMGDDLIHPVDLDIVLRELEVQDAEKLRMVELRFFLGFTATETAELMDISKAKVDRDLRFVRSWMKMRLLGARTGDSAV